MAASGPDSREPSVMFSILQAIYLAKEEILITTPYFIPGDSILETLAYSGFERPLGKIISAGYLRFKICERCIKIKL